ncbi:glycosyltransferase family 39 protein [Mucilaginibacter gilvus]|uniref:Glycosyltransferase RgtA/B/C/D-like domain-containing protein n=1 Tax=Mucilaginibacter gilvus TaxID=2305909 RepID=A0A444MNV4_9SPHI|nr:glycosyltransferase family 39 protein [Mucilaginibacter gilvus]RWY52295.1 hypothetical protein EPL05_10275 [Mucilaginibacter gilvus]
MTHIKPKAVLITIAVICIVSIAAIIITQSRGMLYDEAYFIPNIHLITHTGLTTDFLLKLTGSPGPTYAVIHGMLTGITHFSILGIRLTNFGLFLLLLCFIYLNAKLLNAESPVIVSVNFVFVPIVWVVCGLALTETPTMLCAMVSLYFMLLCLKGTLPLLPRIALAILAGVFLSFAILGRSFFLIVVLAFLACIIVNYLITKFDSHNITPSKKPTIVINKTYTPLLLSLFFIFSILLPIRVFMIWRALAPPTETAIVGANNLSLVPWYGMLSFCYCGFVTIILAPKWFVIDKKTIVATFVVSLVFLVFNIYNGYFEFAPFLSAAGRFLNAEMFSWYQRAIPALVVFLSFQFLLSSLIRLWENRHDPIVIYIGLTVLFIAISAIKVKVQFSSRYVAQIVPYFLLLFIPYEKNDWQKVVRVSVGSALGFLSLYFYYHTG